MIFLAGVVIAKDAPLGERLNYLANTSGPTLSSFDTWLFIRSLKTLPLRFERQEANAKEVGRFYEPIRRSKEVLYPNAGAMISIRVLDETKISGFLAALQVFTFAESLGVWKVSSRIQRHRPTRIFLKRYENLMD